MDVLDTPVPTMPTDPIEDRPSPWATDDGRD